VLSRVRVRRRATARCSTDAHRNGTDGGELRDHDRCASRGRGVDTGVAGQHPGERLAGPIDRESHSHERPPHPFEPLDEPPSRTLEERLHRRARLIQLGRDLVVGQPSKLPQQYGLALPVRKLGKLLLQLFHQCVFGCAVGRVRTVRRDGFGQRRFGPGSRPPPSGAALVPRDLREPRPRIDRPNTLVERVVGVQEYLLRGIVGVRRVSQEDVAELENERAVVQQKLAVCPSTSGGRADGHSSRLYPVFARTDPAGR
jgi:hypothetical protein